jgi:hypothetical protein
MGLLDRILGVDVTIVIDAIQGRGPRTPKLIRLTKTSAIFVQTDEQNQVLEGGLQWPVRFRNGQVNVREVRQALRRIGWYKW